MLYNVTVPVAGQQDFLVEARNADEAEALVFAGKQTAYETRVDTYRSLTDNYGLIPCNDVMVTPAEPV